MIVADTSALLAFFNAAEPTHDAVVSVIAREHEPLVVSLFVVAEVDYIAATRLGTDAELAILDELASGAYELAAVDADALRQARDIVDRYRDQSIGVTDASLVALAHRYRTRTILTLDRRHFDVVRPIGGGRFTVLP